MDAMIGPLALAVFSFLFGWLAGWTWGQRSR
jgi:hypothetical protein